MVIFENDYLQDEDILRLCEMCTECEVAYVKTSSGYGKGSPSYGK
jgi:deoxyribose-phosphate aldolase